MIHFGKLQILFEKVSPEIRECECISLDGLPSEKCIYHIISCYIYIYIWFPIYFNIYIYIYIYRNISTEIGLDEIRLD